MVQETSVFEKVPVTSSEFLEIASHRRTYYNLTNKSTLPDDKLKALVEKALSITPTAFDNLATRAALVTGDVNIKIWERQLEELQKILPPGEWLDRHTGQINNVFKVGYGSVITGYDSATVDWLKSNVPGPDHDRWLENSCGMMQFVTWTALCAEGMGASLQHHCDYGPAVTQAVLEAAGLPKTWKISAIIPFGVTTGGPSKVERPLGEMADRFKFVQGQ